VPLAPADAVRDEDTALREDTAPGVDTAPDADTVPASGHAPAAADGWDVVGVVVGEAGELARELAGYGPDVVVLAPADLRDQVVRVLRGVLEGPVPPAATLPRPVPAGRSR
jgi:predicted DNA-binding transcriptional regulator YafY